MSLAELKYTEEMMDGRRKLSADSKMEIRKKYEAGGHSLLSLSRTYGVSKKTILMTVNADSEKNWNEYNKGRWALYYDKDKRREYTRTYRAKKRMLGFMNWKTDNRKPV